MYRFATIRCFIALHGLGPPTRIPTIPVGPIWKLLGLEGNVYRRQPLFRDIASQARLQGRLVTGGRAELVFEGHEQDHGFYKVGEREA